MTARGGWSLHVLLAVGAAVLVFALALTFPFTVLDRLGYDLGMRLSSRTPAPEIAVVTIDEPTIAQLGPGGWSRSIDAQVIDSLAAAGAKVIGYAGFFPDAAADPAAEQVSRLDAVFRSLDAQAQAQLPQLGQALQQARRAADADARLADSLARAGNVILPLRLQMGGTAAAGQPASARGVAVPLWAPFAQRAAGIGHLNQLLDGDGRLRRTPLVISHEGDPIPAFALQVAARALGHDDGDLVLNLGRDVSLGARRWHTDEHLNLAGYFYPAMTGGAAFPVDSFIDLYQGRVQTEKYRDRVVLVGPTAARLAPRYETPRGVALPEVVVLAHVVSTLLQDDVPRTATWSKLFLAVVLMAAALYLALVLPRLRPLPALLITGTAVAALAGIQLLLMAVHLLWVPTGAALCLLLAGHPLARLTRRFAPPAAVSAEPTPAGDIPVGNHRILGLAHHGQGQLDLAFEQFQQCPVDALVMDNLYNLALDYERRRQYNKAQAVFEYMARHDPTFRDLQQRTARAKQLSEAGAVSSTAPGVETRPADVLQASRLGRYEIERELGKGAMGVVYLGRDPKIGREVAIKTLALSTEFDEQELEQVRQRFFREAESAGRLTHPNIVTIFDAGEDHDLAYIAMEFLKGQDLSAYTKPQALLPLPAVISVMARVADALDYAHRQNVVHRDIKPGNIMYDPTSDTVKVTDFGIARITDSNRTKTGIVLGTPSFMSPEQLSGKKIDGQSDLFSLGVTLYQLCCGALPFKGESMAQLMYRIANESPADPLSLNPALPDSLLEVLRRALAKQKEGRFQSGAEMAEALRACQSAFTSVDLAL